MKKITSIFLVAIVSLLFVSCGQKEAVDTSEAPAAVKEALNNAYQLSKDLTELQLSAGADMKLDEAEIKEIGESFRYLAIVNNINARDYATDKYFIALKKEYKDSFDILADTVIFLKDCEGYDQLGLTIQQISLEARDVLELPVIEELEPELQDTVTAEPMEE